jgi:hypothetical protein
VAFDDEAPMVLEDVFFWNFDGWKMELHQQVYLLVTFYVQTHLGSSDGHSFSIARLASPGCC